MAGWTEGKKDGWLAGQMDKKIWMAEWIGKSDGWLDGINGWLEKIWLDKKMDGLMDWKKWMVGWMDRTKQMDGYKKQMDGSIDRKNMKINGWMAEWIGKKYI